MKREDARPIRGARDGTPCIREYSDVDKFIIEHNLRYIYNTLIRVLCYVLKDNKIEVHVMDTEVHGFPQRIKVSVYHGSNVINSWRKILSILHFVFTKEEYDKFNTLILLSL